MDKHAENLYKVRCNVVKMLEARGYSRLVSGKNVVGFEDFQKFFVVDGEIVNKGSMNFIMENSKNGDLIMVHFSSELSIGIQSITKLFEQMKQAKISRCILIYENTITAAAKKYLAKIQKASIQAFSEEDLQVNIMDHVKMPKYHVLTSTEKMNFLQQAGTLSENQLPRISVNDPVAKYFAMKRGEIIKVVRRSETAGLSTYYRICN